MRYALSFFPFWFVHIITFSPFTPYIDRIRALRNAIVVVVIVVVGLYVDEDGYDTLWASLLCWNRDDIWNGGRKEERRRLNSYFI